MTDTPRSVMLFAAGFGTRMGALTRDRPKPLVKVAGRALIDHSLDLVRAIEPSRIVANVHYLADQMADHLLPQGVVLSRESPRILETGGGLKFARHLLGTSPVFTMNTDAIWVGPNPLDLLRDNWRPDCMDALLVCVPVDRAVGHAGAGDFTTDTEGRITRGPGLVYGGAQIICTDRLDLVSEESFSLNLVWDQMQADGRLFALTYPGHWCDVGTPDGIGLAEHMLEKPRV